MDDELGPDETPTLEIGFTTADAVQAGADLYMHLALGGSLEEILWVIADLAGLDRQAYVAGVGRVVTAQRLTYDEET